MRKALLPLLLSAAMLAGCAATGGSNAPAGEAPQLAGKTFMWAGGVSDECELPPTLAFSEDGRISGLAGCNRLLGRYTQDGVKLDFGGQIGTTMKLCGPAFMKVEADFLALLNQTAYATKSGEDGIDLWNAAGEKVVTLVPERAGHCE